jgi:hypothetical protein
MMSRFDEFAGPLIDAVTAGETLDQACGKAGLSVNTARTWARRGRKEPDGRYGGFAAALDAARDAFRSDPSAMTHEELEQRLAKAIRAGSVQAMRLWVGLHPVDAPAAAAEDPFARFDELARKRDERHVA